MESYSKRFQSTRSYSNFNCPRGAKPTTSLNSEWYIKNPEPLLNTNKPEKPTSPSLSQSQRKHKSPFRLLYNLANILYVCTNTCVYLIVKCLQYFQVITCQKSEKHEDSHNKQDKHAESSFTTINNNHTDQRRCDDQSINHFCEQESSSGWLYSSDSEEEYICNQPKDSLTTARFEKRRRRRFENLTVDDYELPFVRLVDNVIYFSHLYCTNYPAFVQELAQSFRNLGYPTRRIVYGHNLNPKEKRPKIVKIGIEILKRRKLKQKMSRVNGDAHKQWILRIALCSRLLIFLAQGILTNLPEVFKHNNDGFKFTPEDTYGKMFDRLVNSTFTGYINWDAHYFLHISVYGYTSENMLAFFPLLPMLLYCPSRILYFLLGSAISLSSIVVFLGALLNTWLFIKCTQNIYEIVQFRVGASRQLLTAACLMFSFNPASIFFSGLYTETLFAYLSSSVILCLLRKQLGLSLTFAAISCLCRSNGILNVGFILALDLQDALRNTTISKLFCFVLRSSCKLIYALSPFLLFQIYGVTKFCDDVKLYDHPTDVPLYCVKHQEFGFQSLPYFYIQNKYWNVGFLGYFQLKQIPNFILAAPVLYVLGTRSFFTLKYAVFRMYMDRNFEHIYGLFHALHGLFLTIFCFLFVHVQVSTRMIMAACPYLYVHVAAAHIVEVEKFRNQKINLPTTSLGITLWCILYYAIGTIGFSLGLPWT